MSRKRLALGLDASTQSLSVSVLDIDERKILAELSLDYLKDERILSGFENLTIFFLPAPKAKPTSLPLCSWLLSMLSLMI